MSGFPSCRVGGWTLPSPVAAVQWGKLTRSLQRTAVPFHNNGLAAHRHGGSRFEVRGTIAAPMNDPATPGAPPRQVGDVQPSELFLNRDLSMLEFNRRVLELAK